MSRVSNGKNHFITFNPNIVFFLFLKDIRSFFTVISKKGSKDPPKPKQTTKKVAVISDDEDIIPETPPQNEKASSKKRKIQVLSSDSEEEKEHKPRPRKEKKTNETPKKNLKPLNNLEAAFGNTPVKQKKIEVVKSKNEEKKSETELGVHGDPAFDETLLDLDNELLEQNAEILDKTIEEALAKNAATPSVNDSEKGILMGSEGTPKRKRKHSETGEEVDNDQERYEKRRQSALLYQKYLQRGGPKHPGSKEVPKVRFLLF